MGKKLSALDMAFLGLETQRTPVNVATLQILELPPGYQGNFVRDLLEKLSKEEPGPPFNLKLRETRLPAIPQWVEDKGFHIDYHVRHSALPKPGEMADLLTLVARLHSRVMDRERPLWEFHVIEGLRDNRFAIYLKMHHAAIDGMSGIALLENCYSESPDAPACAPWHGIAAEKRRQNKPQRVPTANALARGFLEQLKITPDLVKLFASHGLKAVGLQSAEAPYLFAAPKSMFNKSITGARRFAVRSISLTQIKDLGKSADATVNDIVLAICSGALRRYLIDHKALPAESLVATIPVSIRHIEQSGNQITYVVAQLATRHKSPLRRLREIKRSTAQAKQEVAAVSPAAATTFTVIAQAGVAFLNRFRLADIVPPPANVVISNVPGPRKTLYLGGAKMLANYPLSVLVDGQALNITVVSYCDNVDFGLMACRDTVPDLDSLAEYMSDAFQELATAARKAPAAVKSKPRTRKPAASKTTRAPSARAS